MDLNVQDTKWVYETSVDGEEICIKAVKMSHCEFTDRWYFSMQTNIIVPASELPALASHIHNLIVEGV
jgi:hypothetical protein